MLVALCWRIQYSEEEVEEEEEQYSSLSPPEGKVIAWFVCGVCVLIFLHPKPDSIGCTGKVSDFTVIYGVSIEP